MLLNNIEYRIVEPIDEYCTSCDLRDSKCWDLKLTESCLANDREDGKYINFKLVEKNIMHVEDVKSELKELATLLSSSFEANTDEQRNLIIELTVMKMRQMSGE
jgi:hypothetical protein